MSTCMETSRNYTYMSDGMVGEVGEFTSKVAKGIRKDLIVVSNNKLCRSGRADSEEDRQKRIELVSGLKSELGDILWFVAGMASVLGWTLEDVAKTNLVKLSARKEAGTIDGDGDGISGAERK